MKVFESVSKSYSSSPASTEAERLVDQRVLTQAVCEAAELLGLRQTELAPILGLSAPTVSRMKTGRYLLHPERPEWQLALLFVRLFRSLDSLVGSREELARAWLRGQDQALGGVPLEMASRIPDLVRVVNYLDVSRASN